MKFKTPRLEKEFNTLIVNNFRLYRIVTAADLFSHAEFGKEVVLTEIFRNPEETALLYKDYPKPPDWRPHENWMGVDLRSSIYTSREIERLLGFLNTFISFGGQRKTAVYHSISGNVAHFHVQTQK